MRTPTIGDCECHNVCAEHTASMGQGQIGSARAVASQRHDQRPSHDLVPSSTPLSLSLSLSLLIKRRVLCCCRNLQSANMYTTSSSHFSRHFHMSASAFRKSSGPPLIPQFYTRPCYKKMSLKHRPILHIQIHTAFHENPSMVNILIITGKPGIHLNHFLGYT